MRRSGGEQPGQGGRWQRDSSPALGTRHQVSLKQPSAPLAPPEAHLRPTKAHLKPPPHLKVTLLARGCGGTGYGLQAKSIWG